IVALDVSGSVTGSGLDQLAGSLQELRADLTTHDRLKLLTFNMRIKEVADFGAPAAATDAGLNRVTPAGSAADCDAVAVAVTASPSAERRRLVVLFSDGEDSGSITDRDVLMEAARRTTPTLDVVLASSLGTEATVSARALPTNVAMQKMYTELARETG